MANFNSASDIYQSFLDGIRRQGHSFFSAQKFVRIWNEWAIPAWVKENTSLREGVDISSKQIEDLQGLIVTTDGVHSVGAFILNPIDVEPDGYRFKLPKLSQLSTYPRVLRTLSVRVLLNDGGGYRKAHLLRSNRRNMVLDSKIIQPSQTNIYYYPENNYLRIWCGDEYQGSKIKLTYVRQPNAMSYNSEVTPPWIYDIDMTDDQLEEIRNKAVEIYLERYSDPRYQSFFQGQQLSKADRAV